MENNIDSPKVKFLSELLEVEAVIGDNAVQTSVIMDVTLNNCRSIKKTSGTVENITAHNMKNKVIVEGAIKARVGYVDTADQYLKTDLEDNFSQLIDLPGITEESDIYTRARIESIKIYQLNDNDEGDISFRLVFILEIFIKAAQVISLEVVTDVEGVSSKQVNKEIIKIDNFIGQNYNQTRIKEIFNLERAAEKIVFAEARIAEDGYSLAEGKIYVEGMLIFCFDYYSNGDRYSVEEQRPFSQIIEIEKVSSGTAIDYLPRILDVDYRINEDQVEFNLLVDIFIRAVEGVEIELVTDIEGVPVNKESLYASSFVGVGVSKFNQTRRMDFSAPLDKVEVSAFWFKDLECETLEDKVVVTGTIEMEILYSLLGNESEMQKKYREEREEEDFRHFIHIPGVRPWMNVCAYPRVEEINFEINGPEFQQTSIIAISARAVKTELHEIVLAQKVEIPEEASLVVYIIQPGDTALKIARRYGIELETLRQVNQLENPDLIMPGEKLLLPLK